MTPAQVAANLMDTAELALPVLGYFSAFALLGAVIGAPIRFQQRMKWLIRQVPRWTKRYR